MADIRRMQLGQLVDFIESYNERNREDKKPKKRMATQAEIDAYFG